MKPENKKFLEDNEHTWITLRDAGYMMGLDGATRSTMARIICEEFQPGYATDLWCPPCVADMVTLLYRHYNAWKEKNSTPVIDPLHSKKAEMLEGLIKIPRIDVVSEFGHGDQAAIEKIAITFEEQEKKPEPIQPIKASFPKHPNKHRR